MRTAHRPPNESIRLEGEGLFMSAELTLLCKLKISSENH